MHASRGKITIGKQNVVLRVAKRIYFNTDYSKLPCGILYARGRLSRIPCGIFDARGLLSRIPCGNFDARGQLSRIPCGNFDARGRLSRIHVEILTLEVDCQESHVEFLTLEVDCQEFYVEFLPRRVARQKTATFFCAAGLHVKKRWPFSAPQGCTSKNDGRFLRCRVARQKTTAVFCAGGSRVKNNLFREACARGVGEGKRENRFIRMEIVPVSNEPIGVVAVPEHVFGREFEWFMLSSAFPHRRRSRQRP